MEKMVCVFGVEIIVVYGLTRRGFGVRQSVGQGCVVPTIIGLWNFALTSSSMSSPVLYYTLPTVSN